MRWERRDLSVNDLIAAGITYISPDGKEVYRHGKKAAIVKVGNYMAFAIYYYDENGNHVKVYPKNRKWKTYYTYKQRYVLVHRANFLWNNKLGIRNIPKSIDIDHIDNNKLNNDINNLQMLSRRNNILKSKKKSKYIPKGFVKDKYDVNTIISKINFYAARIENTKAERTEENRHEIEEKLHSQRGALAQWRRRFFLQFGYDYYE